MKRVIIFGASGYIGEKVFTELNNEDYGYIVEGITRSSKVMPEGKWDVLIYFASTSPKKNPSTEDYVVENMMTLIKMLKVAEKHKVDRIIYTSSDSIYGDLTSMKEVDETSGILNPSMYGISKYVAENIIKESGIPYYIFRLPGVVGGRVNDNFLNRILKKAMRDEPISCYNLNKDFNNVVYISDLIRFVRKLIDIKYDEKSEIFTLGLTQKVLLRDVLTYITAIAGSKTEIVDLGEGGKRYFTLSVDKAKEYGYSSTDLYEIINILYKEFKDENFK